MYSSKAWGEKCKTNLRLEHVTKIVLVIVHNRVSTYSDLNICTGHWQCPAKNFELCLMKGASRRTQLSGIKLKKKL